MKESGEPVPANENGRPSRRDVLTNAASLVATAALPSLANASLPPADKQDIEHARMEDEAEVRRSAEAKKFEAFMTKYHAYFTNLLKSTFTTKEQTELFGSVADYLGTQLVRNPENSFVEAFTRPDGEAELYAVLSASARRIKKQPELEHAYPVLLKVDEFTKAIVEKVRLEIEAESQK